jgi:hypothetical protein
MESGPSLKAKNARLLREGSILEPNIKNPFVHSIELRRVDKIKVSIIRPISEK